MTKKELAFAQYLLHVAEGALKHGDTLDPKRAKAGEYGTNGALARHCDQLCRTAMDAFYELLGKQTYEVNEFELSTENPAEWTKNARQRFDRED